MIAQPSNAAAKKLARTAVDSSVVGLSLIFGIAASCAGAVEGGVAASVLALPLYHSMANLLSRYPDGKTVVSSGYVDRTGLEAAGKALKAAFTNSGAALAMATIVGFVGLTAGVLNDSIRHVVEEQKQDQLLDRLPTLSPDTEIDAQTTASDLCINHRGQKISYIYKAIEYKIDCR